jgi:DNA-binding transcriptional regulator YiaG
MSQNKFAPKVPAASPEEIKALREKLNLSVLDVSKLLKVHADNWEKWESGSQKMPAPVFLLLKIAVKNGTLFILSHY